MASRRREERDSQAPKRWETRFAERAAGSSVNATSDQKASELVGAAVSGGKGHRSR